MSEVHIDVSNDMFIIRTVIAEAAAFISAPHVTMKPSVYPDGNMWCCLYGENLQVGVAGFGKSPSEACAEFDKAWSSGRTPIAARAALAKAEA